jgi:hypothetical protein
MVLRKTLNALRDWCPQPQSKIPANFKALSMPLLASILIAEVVLLLVSPIAYSALLMPKAAAVPPFSAREFTTQVLPLTNSQIMAAWPHLPTAQEVADGNYSYGLITSYQPQNDTTFALSDAYSSPPGAFICYNIWLQLNSTTWIQVPYHYLATSNPPYPQYIQASSTGFLGTGLPTTYVAVAIAVIIVTLLAGISYVLHKKTRVTKNEGR